MSIKPEDVKAIVFIDVDGTALRKEGENHRWENESWFLLTAGFNASIDAHKKIYGKYRENITHDPEKDQALHDQMVGELIDLWEEAWGSEITREDLVAACQMIENQVSVELKKAVTDLMSNNILVIMGTGGFELAAKAIAEALNLEDQLLVEDEGSKIEYWFGNTEFIFNNNGVLTSFEHDKDIPARKAAQASEKMHQIFSIIAREVPVFAVGDGMSDFILFYLANGIAFKATDRDFILAAKAEANDWSSVKSAILFLLDKIEREREDGV